MVVVFVWRTALGSRHTASGMFRVTNISRVHCRHHARLLLPHMVLFSAIHAA